MSVFVLSYHMLNIRQTHSNVCIVIFQSLIMLIEYVSACIDQLRERMTYRLFKMLSGKIFTCHKFDLFLDMFNKGGQRVVTLMCG